MSGAISSAPKRLMRTAGAASCVREPVRFFGRELSGRSRTDVYRLRGSELRTVIRHPLLDLWVLEEIFRNRGYALPPAVERGLRSLGRPPRVLDLGGHVGLFGLWFLSRFDNAGVVSLEPDPENAAILRRCVAVNGLAERWEVIEAAASNADGTASFISDFQLSQLGDDPSVLGPGHAEFEQIFPFLAGRRLMKARPAVVATRDVLPDLRRCDFLKVDIQGGEWDLLMDPRFLEISATALVVEVHPQGCPGDDPVSLAVERFERAGFTVEPPVPAHGAESIVWATRSRRAAAEGSAVKAR
jgi:FkbM family methyltransferase